jgi:hypothetical protein
MERQGNFGHRMKKVVLQESKDSTAVAQPEENKVPRDSSRRGGGKVGRSAEVCAAGGGGNSHAQQGLKDRVPDRWFTARAFRVNRQIL